MVSITSADKRQFEQERRWLVKDPASYDLSGRSDITLVSLLRVDIGQLPIEQFLENTEVQKRVRAEILKRYVDASNFVPGVADWITVASLCSVLHWFGPRNTFMMLQKSMDSRLLKIYHCELKNYGGSDEADDLIRQNLPQIHEMTHAEMLRRYVALVDGRFAHRPRLLLPPLPPEDNGPKFYNDSWDHEETEHDL
jgi:hypothetical protein